MDYIRIKRDCINEESVGWIRRREQDNSGSNWKVGLTTKRRGEEHIAIHAPNHTLGLYMLLERKSKQI